MSTDPSTRLSVAEVLTNLEEQMASHREKEAYHAEQEIFHREQRAHHVAELERVARHYEAFKAVAGSAVELAARSIPESGAREARLDEILPPGSPVLRSRLVIRLAEQQPADAVFSASSLAEEVNRRFGSAFEKPANARLAAAALRRLCANGVLRVVQPGTPHHEARYARVSPSSAAEEWETPGELPEP